MGHFYALISDQNGAAGDALQAQVEAICPLVPLFARQQPGRVVLTLDDSIALIELEAESTGAAASLMPEWVLVRSGFVSRDELGSNPIWIAEESHRAEMAAKEVPHAD